MDNPIPNAIMVINPQTAIDNAKAIYQIISQMRSQVLIESVDFGVIPGTDKPSLFKPGAEKLCSALGYDPKFEFLDKIENFDDENALFHYNVICRLIHIATGQEIATGIGSCNSKESKYRWRWVDEADIPQHLDKAKLKTRNSSVTEPAFAIDKAETTGKYGKPAEYWNAFKSAIAAGTAVRGTKTASTGKVMDTWSIGGTAYRIPNDEVFSLTNTIQKMACKRALVAAVLIGANASEFFTQDIEDMRDFSGDFVEGNYSTIDKITGEIKPTGPAVVIPTGEKPNPFSAPAVTTPAPAPKPLETASNVIPDWFTKPVKETWKDLHPYLLERIYKGNKTGKEKSMKFHADATNGWEGMTAGEVVKYLEHRHDKPESEAS